MYDHRSNASVAILSVVMVLRLIHQFNHATRHLRHLTLHRWPAVVLELGDLNRILHFAIGNIELAAGVVRTAFAVHVLNENMVVLDLVVGPVAWAFFRCVTDLRNVWGSL